MMTERLQLTLEVTPEQLESIEALAEEHGYSTPGDYLLALAEAEAVHAKQRLLDPLRESLLEAKRGEVYPIEQLSELLQEDED
jgi:hypothetical protein